MPGYSVALIASSLLACSGLAAAAEEFSIAPLSRNVFAIVRNDPPGFAVESNSGFIECRDQVVLSDLRRQFAGDSLVHATLFDAYVGGPAVTNAWNIASSAGS